MCTAVRFDHNLPDARCAALAQALADWSREETDALLAALPDDAHAALHPNADALTDALAHPDRRNAFRQALDALDALPPSAALPARHALDALAQVPDLAFRRHAGEGLATVLCRHGRIVAAIAVTLNDKARSAVLSRRDHLHDESALAPSSPPTRWSPIVWRMRCRKIIQARSATHRRRRRWTRCRAFGASCRRRSSSSCAATATHCSPTSPAGMERERPAGAAGAASADRRQP
jgi:hypothetical protein